MLNKHTLDCEGKSWKLLRFSKMHIKAFANSHSFPNHHPLNLTVTLPNLQYTAIAAKDARRNTEWCGRCVQRKAKQSKQFSQ